MTLVPAVKRAIVVDFAEMSEGEAPKDGFREFFSLLMDAQGDKPGLKREPLGEKEIDGRQVVGYRLSGRGQVYCLWGDPKTGRPPTANGKWAARSRPWRSHPES